MQFNPARTNPNLWKGTGTVTGIHTYEQALRLSDNSIERKSDPENTVHFDSEGVVIAKNLKVLGQLITPGFPPTGGGGSLPEEPTFKTVTATDMIKSYKDGFYGGNLIAHELHVPSAAMINVTQTNRLQLNSGGTIGAHGNILKMTDNGVDLFENWDFTNANTTGINFPEHPTFQSIVTAGNVTINDSLYVPGDSYLGKVSATDVISDSISSYNSSATFLDVNVIRPRTVGSFVSVDSNITVDGNLQVKKVNGTDGIFTGLVDGHIVSASSAISSQGTIEGEIIRSNGLLQGDSLIAKSQAIVEGVLLVNGNSVCDGTLSVKKNTTLDGDVHIKGNLTVDGEHPGGGGNTTIPNHIHTQHITLNKDFTFGHQKTEITYNKITLEDTDPSFFGTGGMGEITLDATKGSIKCNGTVTVHNQYTSTANPAGVICDYVDTLNVSLDTITGHRSDFGRNVAGESIYCNGQIESATLKTGAISGTITAHGSWDFSGATVTGLPSSGGGGNGTVYQSITEYADHLDINRRLTVSHIGWENNNPVNFQGNINFTGATVTGMPDHTPSVIEYVSHVECEKNFRLQAGLRCAHIEPLEDAVIVTGSIDFTNATVTGLPGSDYPSITETDTNVVITKPTTFAFTENGTSVPHLLIRDDFIESIVPVRALNFGYDDAGLEFTTGNEKRIDFKLDNSNILSIRKIDPGNGLVTQTIDYSDNTLLNDLYVTAIHARPPNLKINMANAVEFQQDVEFKGHVDTGNATFSGFTVAAGNMIQFIPQPSNPVGFGTRIDDISIQTQFIGMSHAEIAFQGYSPQVILNKISGENILSISNLLVDCARPLHTINKGSSGNFTHCHITEGSQATVWEVGRVVTSTGEFCARDDEGNMVTPTTVPDITHAMCKVRYATKGDSPLGIIASVEHVTDNLVNHEHGGITLRTSVQETDGHKMLRVAGSGDIMAWVVEPLFTEIDLPPLSGLWQKCVENNGYNAGHTVISNHVAVEADGYLSIDNQIIDTNTATTIIQSDNICIYPTDPALTPALFSGVYNKSINGINQPIQVVMHCNQDYSFSFSEHFPGFEQRVSALEATIAELTGPE